MKRSSQQDYARNKLFSSSQTQLREVSLQDDVPLQPILYRPEYLLLLVPKSTIQWLYAMILKSQ